MPIVTVGNAEVYYRVEGGGPGLVLVHGTGGDSLMHWGRVLEGFTDAWTVVRPDLSGSGETHDDGGPLDVAGLAAQVLAAARDAGLERFDVAGYSMGAAVAIHLAAQQPQAVRRLVLAAGFAHAGDARMRMQFGLWRHLLVRDRRSFCEMAMLTGFSPAFLGALDEETIGEFVTAGLQGNRWDGIARQILFDEAVDVRAELSRISQPTLVIGCRQDFMVPQSHAQYLAQEIAGASYVELDSGHLLPLEQPRLFIDTVRPFLAAA